jgi:glutathione S-transferase
VNPQKQVPTLEALDRVTGRVVRLAQSLPIIEFLDEAFPEVGG